MKSLVFFMIFFAGGCANQKFHPVNSNSPEVAVIYTAISLVKGNKKEKCSDECKEQVNQIKEFIQKNQQ